MRLLLLISLMFFQVSCKSQDITSNTFEGYVLIASLGDDNFFLFPIINYDNNLSLDENLKVINIKQGKLLNHITEKQYNDILINSTEYKRSDVPDDFDDSVKYIKLKVSRVKYQYVNEKNPQLHKKHKKLERQKIKLNNNITLNLRYNYLGVELL